MDALEELKKLSDAVRIYANSDQSKQALIGLSMAGVMADTAVKVIEKQLPPKKKYNGKIRNINSRTGE